MKKKPFQIPLKNCLHRCRKNIFFFNFFCVRSIFIEILKILFSPSLEEKKNCQLFTIFDLFNSFFFSEIQSEIPPVISSRYSRILLILLSEISPCISSEISAGIPLIIPRENASRILSHNRSGNHSKLLFRAYFRISTWNSLRNSSRKDFKLKKNANAVFTY